VASPSRRPAASLQPEELLEGIRQFNSWRFYDCHETLEDLWLAEDDPEPRNLYHGIIKLAAGFHHLLRANYRGALSLWEGGLALLRPLRPARLGIDLDALVVATEKCAASLRELGPQRIGEFDRSLIPPVENAR
jgi:predicted metal-dependent hydrolase